MKLLIKIMIAMMCAFLLHGCMLFRKVIDLDELTYPDTRESFFVVDTIEIPNPVILRFGEYPRIIIDSCELQKYDKSNIKEIFNNTINYVFTDLYYDDYPYRPGLSYEQYGKYCSTARYHAKDDAYMNIEGLRLLTFEKKPKAFLLALINVAYFNKRYNGWYYIKTDNPSNTYVKIVYPL